MEPLSAAIGAAAGLFGQGLSNAAAKRAATTSFKRQKQLFDYQAAYNTPANQMRRLKEAGLNPALMYGKGTVGNVDSFAGVQQAKTHGVDLAHSAAMGAQISLTNSQQKKADEEAKLLRNQQVLTNETAKKVTAEILKIEEDKAKVIQETLNLKTQGDILEVEEMLKKVEHSRAKKGTLKGDALGNMLSILNLDPMNNESDRTLIKSVLTVYFGSKVAKDIMQGIGSFIPFKKGGK